MILVLLVPFVFINGQSKLLRGTVRSWPAGYDTTGKHWVTYNYYKPITHWGNEVSINSLTQYSSSGNFVRWTCDIGNYNGAVNPWVPGDTIVAMGSVDSVYIHDPAGYPNRINHCGFYWLFRDTVTPATPELWTPDDTLRPMPKPIVFKRGNGGLTDDTVVIRIPNPNQTQSSMTQYFVLGYMLYADTTGAGTPNAYNNLAKVIKIKFLIAQGAYGDTTTLKIMESVLCPPPNIEWPVYFTYKIGAKPDTTVSAVDTSGYLTYYFSQNSDSIHILHNVVSVEDQSGAFSSAPRISVAPNPFTNMLKISIASVIGPREINIFDISGNRIKSFGLLSQEQMPYGHLYWNGRDNDGNPLPAGVYFIEVKNSAGSQSRKVILER